MSKLAVFCKRRATHEDPRLNAEFYNRAGPKLAPWLVEQTATPAFETDGKGLAMAVFSPGAGGFIHGLAAFVGSPQPWQQEYGVVSGAVPDGNFGLVRAGGPPAFGEAMLEVCADALATYPLWYYFDEEVFVVASMQRLAVMLLGSFEFNHEAVPWLLSSGALGPFQSWDARLRPMLPGMRLRLDRQRWKLASTAPEVVFEPDSRPATQLKSELRQLLTLATASITDADGPWLLPLSGGADSRALMQLTRTRLSDLTAATHGYKHFENHPQGNMAVAKAAAAKAGVRHLSLAHDYSLENPLQRATWYLQGNDGREFLAYRIFDQPTRLADLATKGFRGWIRGDEVFGWLHVASEYEVRRNVGMLMLSDFDNFPDACIRKLPPQTLHPILAPLPSETMEARRDRYYQLYRLPNHLGFYTDLITHQFHLANPFLDGRIVQFIRTVPDALRTNKALFASIAKELGPAVPYAAFDDHIVDKDLVAHPQLQALVRQYAAEGAAKGLFPLGVATFLTKQLPECSGGNIRYANLALGKQRAKKIIRKFVPKALVGAAVQNFTKPQADFSDMALHLFLITLVNDVYEHDAELLASAYTAHNTGPVNT